MRTTAGLIATPVRLLRAGLLAAIAAACAANGAKANDASYYFAVRNRTRSDITLFFSVTSCVTMGKKAVTILPGAAHTYRFYRSGDCHGKQGRFRLIALGRDVSGNRSEQGFEFDAAGALVTTRDPAATYRYSLSGPTHLNDDAVEYALDILSDFVPIDEYYARLRNKVGRPATTDPAKFATRVDLGVPPDQTLVFDLGGEGEHQFGGVMSGFREAINFNAQERDSQPPNGPIPHLIKLNDWSTDPPYPVANGTGNYVVMQGAPLTEKNVSEIARITAVGGKIGLWIDRDQYALAINRLARLVGDTARYSMPLNDECHDEFAGHAGFDKICLTRWR